MNIQVNSQPFSELTPLGGLVFIFFYLGGIWVWNCCSCSTLWPEANPNQAWKLIKGETLSGKLGIKAYGMTAKKKAESNSKNYKIIIYSKDIQDKKDIARILERLLELGFSNFVVKEV